MNVHMGDGKGRYTGLPHPLQASHSLNTATYLPTNPEAP